MHGGGVSHRTVRVTVIGDAHSGKTSLISTAANDTFDSRPPPALPAVKLPREFSPDMVPMIITDTSSRPEDGQALDQAVQQADVVVICFDAQR
jgi:Ras family protein T1